MKTVQSELILNKAKKEIIGSKRLDAQGGSTERSLKP